MVWVKSLENTYVNADNIISLTYDQKCNSFVAVIGYHDKIRLQHVIYHNNVLDNLLQGTTPRSESEIIERIIRCIETAKQTGDPVTLDFNQILAEY
ncbi:MAG: hypothetical protein JXA08_07015 [Methanomicrobiaceae archaeon]|nr:hypothetical protein [Methanomicrobiaceae archaeon]